MEFEELKIEVPIGVEETPNLPEIPERIYENEVESFAVGFDVTSKEAEEKRQRRARRFGIKNDEKESSQEEDSDEALVLPENLPSCKDTVVSDDVRSDALFVYGVNEMSTKDIFRYFEDCPPGSVEWVDDFSCVVVWDDEYSAKRVYMNKGKEPTKSSTESEDTDADEENSTSQNSSLLAWRIAPKTSKGSQLYLRYAVKTDKKLPGAAKHSMYYLVHGNPNKKQNFKGNRKGLISSSRKRRMHNEKQFAKHAVESAGEPLVEIIDKADDDEDEEMEVDEENEPAVKVLLTEDGIRRKPDSSRMRLYADESQDGARSRIKDRLGARDSRDFLNQRRNEQKLQRKELDSHSGDEYEGEQPSRNLPDLRHKLKRGKGFSIKDKPTLSIEIKEEEAS